MSFEYRELTTQVFLHAGKGDEPPDCSPCNTCGTTTLEHDTDDCDEDDDEDCSCGTTTLDTGSVGCDDDDDDDDDQGRGKGKGQQALGLLRQQLRDALAAG